MTKEEKRKYEAFQYWIQTNTEKGVTTIPDDLCLFAVNLINKLQKENEEFKILKKENEQLRTEVNSLKAKNEELKILKSGIQTLQDLRIEDGKYIVMSKNDFLNGSCKHLLDDYISRQKIKDEIKELDKRIKNPEKISYWASYTISECIGIRSILQELLEETEK